MKSLAVSFVTALLFITSAEGLAKTIDASRPEQIAARRSRAAAVGRAIHAKVELISDSGDPTLDREKWLVSLEATGLNFSAFGSRSVSGAPYWGNFLNGEISLPPAASTEQMKTFVTETEALRAEGTKVKDELKRQFNINVVVEEHEQWGVDVRDYFLLINGLKVLAASDSRLADSNINVKQGFSNRSVKISDVYFSTQGSINIVSTLDTSEFSAELNKALANQSRFRKIATLLKQKEVSLQFQNDWSHDEPVLSETTLSMLETLPNETLPYQASESGKKLKIINFGYVRSRYMSPTYPAFYRYGEEELRIISNATSEDLQSYLKELAKPKE